MELKLRAAEVLKRFVSLPWCQISHLHLGPGLMEKYEVTLAMDELFCAGPATGVFMSGGVGVG